MLLQAHVEDLCIFRTGCSRQRAVCQRRLGWARSDAACARARAAWASRAGARWTWARATAPPRPCPRAHRRAPRRARPAGCCRRPPARACPHSRGRAPCRRACPARCPARCPAACRPGGPPGRRTARRRGGQGRRGWRAGRRQQHGVRRQRRERAHGRRAAAACRPAAHALLRCRELSPRGARRGTAASAPAGQLARGLRAVAGGCERPAVKSALLAGRTLQRRPAPLAARPHSHACWRAGGVAGCGVAEPLPARCCALWLARVGEVAAHCRAASVLIDVQAAGSGLRQALVCGKRRTLVYYARAGPRHWLRGRRVCPAGVSYLGVELACGLAPPLRQSVWL